MGMIGDGPDNLAVAAELGQPFQFNRAAGQHEGLAHDQPGMREGGTGLIDEILVILLKYFQCAAVPMREGMPEIVHADHNAQQIGFKGQAIRRPSADQFTYLIAADAAIETGH